jgi:hypothetical protein
MIQKDKNQREFETEAEKERKAKEGRRLFYIFGVLIVVLIALMFFVDYYAQSQAGGARNVHDAADPG